MPVESTLTQQISAVYWSIGIFFGVLESQRVVLSISDEFPAEYERNAIGLSIGDSEYFFYDFTLYAYPLREISTTVAGIREPIISDQ